MPDIFDELETSQEAAPSGDIFDQITPQRTGDIFDQLPTEEPAPELPSFEEPSRITPAGPVFAPPTGPVEKPLYAQETWADMPAIWLGKSMKYAGEKAKDVVGAMAFEAIGEPGLAAQQLGLTPEQYYGTRFLLQRDTPIPPEMLPEPDTGEKPIEAGMKALPTVPRLASKAAYGLVETTPQLATVAALQSVGVPSTISAPIIFGATPEGFDATQAALVAGIPIVGRVGEGLVAKALTEIPVVRVALEQVGNTEKLRGKVVQSLGGVEFSSDQFRKFMEAGGNLVAVNSYLLAERMPDIMKLPEDQREDAILQTVAQNLGPSLLGFISRGDMSQSLRTIVQGMAPELADFIARTRRPPSGPGYEATPEEAARQAGFPALAQERGVVSTESPQIVPTGAPFPNVPRPRPAPIMAPEVAGAGLAEVVAPEGETPIDVAIAGRPATPTPPTVPVPPVIPENVKGSRALYKNDALEFRKLVREYGQIHGWIKDIDAILDVPISQTGQSTASLAAQRRSNAELAASYKRALKFLGFPTEVNNYTVHAAALPKLKEFLDKHAKLQPVALSELPDGSEFTIAGEKFRVKGTDPDSGIVTIVDGRTIKVDERGSIAIDPGSLKAKPVSTEFVPEGEEADPEGIAKALGIVWRGSTGAPGRNMDKYVHEETGITVSVPAGTPLEGVKAELERRKAEYKPGPVQLKNTNEAYAHALTVKSVADLEKLAAEHQARRQKARDLMAQAEKEPDKAKSDALVRQANLQGAQYYKEAIYAATNTGSAVEGEGAYPLKLGPRPLDWSKNPEVVEWLKKNAEGLGLVLPDALTPKAPPAPTTAPAGEPTEAERVQKYAAAMVQSAAGYIRRGIDSGQTPAEAALAWAKEIGSGLMDTPDDVYRKERGGLYTSTYVKGVFGTKEGVAVNAKEYLNAIDAARDAAIKRFKKPTAPAPPVPPAPPPAPPAPPAAPPLITKQRADELIARLKKKLAQQGQAPPPEPDIEPGALADVTETDVVLEMAKPKIDPTIFGDAVQIGAYYIQNGLHKFDAWAAQMRSDFGEKIEPYLKSIYETARQTIESPAGEAGGNLRPPGLQPGLARPEDRIVTARSEHTHPIDDSAVPAELKPHLDPHQVQGAALGITALEKYGGALNADGTGTGKTRQALTVAHYWAKKGFRVIYITRAEAIKPNWKKGTFGGSLFNDSQKMGVKVKLARHGDVGLGEIGITTYENAKAVQRVADPHTVLIWDESHSLKNKSARGLAGDKANDKAHATLFMSATPADKPEHIYYLKKMGILEGKGVSQQMRDLGMALVSMDVLVRDPATGQMRKETRQVWVPDQRVSDTERNERFKALFDRMTAKGAMIKREISMKGVHVQILKVALPPEAHETLQDILSFFDADTIDDLKGLKKATVLMHLRRQQEPFKIAPTVLLAQRELAAGRQVVIFVSRVNESEVGKWVEGPGGDRVREVLMSSEGTAKALRNALAEAGIHDVAEIHGGATQSSLEAMADFNDGKKRVCIATIESGGTGINLDDFVGNRPRSMVIVTAPFDAVGNVQAAGRIWRLKTLSGANIFYLMGDTDVDDWNADIIGSKMAHLGAVVEGQVRRLDISDPDSMTTDDFHGEVGKKSPGAAPQPPAAPGGAAPQPLEIPKLAWKPFRTKSGRDVFVAPATPEFWKWWRASGEGKNPMGWRPSKYQGQWQVWAQQLPTEPQAPPTPPPPTPPPVTEADMGPGGETGAELARHGTATGLPPDVPDGGPNMPQELLEGSRRLGTLVRSRTTLPPGVLGQYVPAMAAIARSDRIEVGDIRNQATVSHEMGHDLDALLFPSIFVRQSYRHSQVSLPDRIALPTTAARKKALFNELAAISVLMRGPMTGSKGHIAYRKRATELIADFFSLYVHDPERARRMAPEWSHGFELALSTNPEAQETVRQLLARNVEPVSPTPAAAGPTAAPAFMPGAVPPRPNAPATREVAAAIAAERILKGEIRRYEAEVQRARIRSENWRRDVPDDQQRNDVGAFVEGTGNLEIAGDTRDAVIARMTAPMKKFAKDYRFHIELQRQRINEYLHGLAPGEYLKFLEDYLPHFYANAKSPAGQQAMARFIKNSPNAKARRIPTFREAVELGLVPITQDPSVLYEVHARINWRVATNRRFLAQLKTLHTSSGQPVIVPAGQNPGSWPVSNNPLIARVYAHQTAAGLMLWRGGAAIHPDVWHAVRQLLEVPIDSDLAKLYDAVNSITRANAFAFSLFHDITLRSASLGAEARLTNPLRGLFRILELDPVTGELRIFQTTRRAGKALLMDEDAVADAALHGLRFAWTESESYQHVARDVLERAAVTWRGVPFLGRSARLARDIQRFRQEGLWRNTHDAFKIIAYHDLVAKALANAPPGTDASAVKQRIASLLNDCFGGQEWQTKFWMSPQVRRNAARFFLAPDWTLSTLRSVPFLSDVFSTIRGQAARLGGRGPAPTPKEGWKGNIGRWRFWTAELAALALGTIAAQFAIYYALGRKENGDNAWVWENETGQNRRIDVTPLMRRMPWAKPGDATRYYVNLGKRPEEILHWFLHPEQNIQSKMARPLIEFIHQITGSEGDFKAPWSYGHQTFAEGLPERLKSAGEQFVPFVFAGNQFALSLPYRKGMTKYKAAQAFEAAYELIAEPNRVRSALRGDFTGNMDRLLEDIRRAAEANGVAAALIEKQANSSVRTVHYRRYFKAYQTGDQKTMDREADALARLGATGQNIQRSMKIRQRLQPGASYQ